MNTHLLCLLLAPAVTAPPDNRAILNNAVVFGMAQGGQTAEQAERLRRIGVDVVVRGISCAWAATPEEAGRRAAGEAKLYQRCREQGLLWSTMITGSAVYEKMVSPALHDRMSTRDAAGAKIPTSGWYQGCLQVPEFRDYTKQIVRRIIDTGIDAVHYDEAYGPWFWRRPIPCFCDACDRGFREFLKAEYGADGVRRRYGFDAQNSTYRAWLKEQGHVAEPWRSPLHDDWWWYTLRSLLAAEREVVDDARRYSREKWGTEFIANSNPYELTTLSAALTVESLVYDFIAIGTGLGLRYRDGIARDEVRLPPLHSTMPMYLMARAATPDKPIVMFLDIQEDPGWIKSLPPAEQGRLYQWLMGEAAASGSYFAAHVRFSGYDGAVEPQAQAAAVFKGHRNYFHRTRPAGEVGVVYAFPSQVWDMRPQHWEPNSQLPAHSMQYYGTCEALMDAGVPFDTVFIGDGEFFAVPPLAQLQRFPYLIVPTAYALPPQAVQRLSEYAAGGGKLLLLNGFAETDSRHRPQQVAAPAQATRLTADCEAYLSRRNAQPLAALTGWLAQSGYRPRVEVPDPQARVWVGTRQTADGRTLLVDLLNRQFDARAGFTPLADLPVEIHWPSHPGTVRCLPIDGPEQTLAVTPGRDGWYTVRVPRLTTYACLALEARGVER